MNAEIGEYKGQPTLSLNPQSRFPFTFGMAKAKLIVENIDAIKLFVASNGANIGTGADGSPVRLERNGQHVA